MTVAAILRDKGGEIIEVRPEDSVADAARLLGEKRIGAVLVRRDGRIEGILSERDIVRAAGADGAGVFERPVSSLMTKDVVRCSPSDSVERVMQLMTDGRFRHLPVMDGDRLVGVVSIGDVVRRRITEVEREADSVREYVAGVG